MAEQNEGSDYDGKTEITQENELSVLGLEERTSWVEMVDASEKSIDLSLSTSLALLLMLVVASHVAEQVQRPSEQLL